MTMNPKTYPNHNPQTDAPKSDDFRDGPLAEGTWIEDGLTYYQVAGNSGLYLIVKDANGIVRDDRPWQMQEGLS